MVAHQPSTSRTLRRFLSAVFEITPRAVVETAIAALVLSVTEGIGLLLLAPLLQLVGLDVGHGGLDRFTAFCAAAFRSVGMQPTLGAVLLVYLATIAAQGWLQRRESMLNARVRHDVVDRFRTRLYRAISGTQWGYFARTRASDYTQLLTDEVERVGTTTYFVIDLAVTGVTVLLYVGLALSVSPAMTLFVLLCGAGLALTMRPRMARARVSGEALSASQIKLHAAIAEHLGSLKIARSYGAERRHTDAFESLSHDLESVAATHVGSHARFRQELAFGSAAVLAAIVYVSYQWLAVSTAQLLLLLFLFARLMPRLTGMYEKAQALATSLPAFDAVIDAERRCLAATAPFVAHPLSLPFARRIDLDRVTFEYRDDGSAPAVRDVTLPIAAGKTTAIVGPSGAGKSTLADLLLGLLTPSHGQILVDGIPLGPDGLADWRRQIGYVAQDTFLFHASVRANLEWAQPGASESEIWHALDLASAEAFVRGLPQGLDTIVGDRGVLVSGGERQRLSLARALLRQPALLILDEATSSLDSENESRIQTAIDGLHQQMTIVVITHRLSTIRNADVIHVIDGGRLVESGSWRELMASPGQRFRELCAAQGVADDAAALPYESARTRAAVQERRLEIVRR